MSNYIYTPFLNPIHIVANTPIVLPQYHSKHFDDYLFEDTILPWEQKGAYCQKVENTDISYFQFTSNFDPILIEVVDLAGRIFLSQNAAQIRQNKWMAGYYIYETAISWVAIPEGIYYIRRTLGSIIERSEPIYVKAFHPNTLYFQYRNSRFHSDVVFETGITFNFRVEGSFGRLEPGSNDQFFNDQKYNPTVLSSLTYNGFPLSIGGTFGVPDWVVRLFNNIFSCNSVLIDGKPFAKTGDFKYEFKEEENYPKRGILVKIMEGINRGSKILNPDINTDLKIGVVYNIETSKIFGEIPSASSNIISITGDE